MPLVKNNAKPEPEIRNPTAGGHHLQKLISATRAAKPQGKPEFGPEAQNLTKRVDRNVHPSLHTCSHHIDFKTIDLSGQSF